MTKVQPKKLPALPLKGKSALGRKLSLAQRSFVLDLLAQGHRPATVREKLRREQGVQVTLPTICGYVLSHREELAQRRRLWNQGLDLVHLRHSRGRLEELVRLYGLVLRELWKVPCGACGAWRKRKGVCGTCRASGKVLSADWARHHLQEALAAGDLRLANSPPPLGWDAAAWDRAAACLKAIREEVGDARPERPEAADALLAAAQAAEKQAYAEQVKRMTSEQFVEALKALGEAREARIAKRRAGSSDDNEVGREGIVSGEPSKRI